LIEHGAKVDLPDIVRNWWLDEIGWINKMVDDEMRWDEMADDDMVNDEMIDGRWWHGKWWDGRWWDMVDDEME